MLISTELTFSWVLIMIWWLSQEYLYTGTPSYTATHKLVHWQWLRQLKIQMRARRDGVKQMCCCSEGRAACIRGEQAQPHTTTHKAIYTCTDGTATQSSCLKANPSIAGWLGSNHCSQQGQRRRMADNPLSTHSRLMAQILGRFMSHPISRRTSHKKSLMWYGTWKQSFNPAMCMCCVFFSAFLLSVYVLLWRYFCHSTVRKPIRKCHEFPFYLFPADNAHFLVFNAAKHPHCLSDAKTTWLAHSGEQKWTGEGALEINFFKCLKWRIKLFFCPFQCATWHY